MKRDEIISKINEILIKDNKDLSIKDLRAIKFILEGKIKLIDFELRKYKEKGYGYFI